MRLHTVRRRLTAAAAVTLLIGGLSTAAAATPAQPAGDPVSVAKVPQPGLCLIVSKRYLCVDA